MRNLWCVLGLAFICALAGSACANYADKADSVLAYVDRTFRDPDSGLYRPSTAIKIGDTVHAGAEATAVQLSALVSAAVYNESRYLPGVKSLAAATARYWDDKDESSGFSSLPDSPGKDRSYDENSRLVCALLSAHGVTADRATLERTVKAFDFVVSGWGADGGLPASELRKGTRYARTNALALIMALRLGRIHDYEAKAAPWARKVLDWMNTRLQDKDGLYFDSIDIEKGVSSTKDMTTAALMIDANIMFYRRTQNKKYLDEARRIAASAEKEFIRSSTGVFEGESGPCAEMCRAFLELSSAARDKHYLQVAQRNADSAHTSARDPRDGGYWGRWGIQDPKRDEPKDLLSNASMALLFANLSPYPDKEELYDAGIRAATAGSFDIAAKRFAEVVAIDDAHVEAHYRLYRCYHRLRKRAEEAAQIKRMVEFYRVGGELKARLAAVAEASVFRAVESEARGTYPTVPM